MNIFASLSEPHLCVTELSFKKIFCIQSSEWCKGNIIHHHFLKRIKKLLLPIKQSLLKLQLHILICVPFTINHIHKFLRACPTKKKKEFFLVVSCTKNFTASNTHSSKFNNHHNSSKK